MEELLDQFENEIDKLVGRYLNDGLDIESIKGALKGAGDWNWKIREAELQKGRQ